MENQSVKQIGIWSGVLVILVTIIFSVFFGLYFSSMPAQWSGIAEFTQAFKEDLYVAWVLPCLILALVYPIFTYTIYYISPKDRKIFGAMGMIYALMYGAILSANYFILLTVVRGSIADGYLEGLEWFVIGSPNSITFALEGAGYGFMGLSMFFIGFTFKNQKVLKSLYVLTGLGGVLSVIGTVLGYVAVAMISLGIWAIIFPITIILTILHFRKVNIMQKDYATFEKN